MANNFGRTSNKCFIVYAFYLYSIVSDKTVSAFNQLYRGFTLSDSALAHYEYTLAVYLT